MTAPSRRGTDDVNPATASVDPADVLSPIPRVRHARRLIGFIGTVVVIGVGAYVAGQYVHASDSSALENSDTVIPVWAQVEDRVVYDGFSLPAAVASAPQQEVFVTEASPYGTEDLKSTGIQQTDQGSGSSGSGGSSESSAPGQQSGTSSEQQSSPRIDRVVISGTGVSAGQRVSPGSLLAEVSGRPVFAWPDSSPLYRDLIVGTVGNDVEAFQTVLGSMGLLGSEPDGVFGPDTLSGITKLYGAAGYEPPVIQGSQRGVSWREFAGIPALPATVVAIADKGSLLDGEHALVSVRSATPTLTATATLTNVDQVQPGTEVAVAAVGHDPAKTTVAAVGEFQTDEKTNVSGYPVEFVFPAELATLPAGTPVTIRRWDETPPTLAVPATAIRQDSDGAYILVPDDAAGSSGSGSGAKDVATRPVRVAVIAQADGWVSIDTRSMTGTSVELEAGTRVLVSSGGAPNVRG